ncbi:maleylpyruvate isomerase N-terminal domain-containing protein [Nakamurella alba]|uniref:maleylpyruvate isomerase N-terminal domain-containing protein n=1 Tax=Nakamurella alba TaxID=2665158 RepID=UPI0018AB926F|nr:maleylpyruvate isomerase N-terminal domain-containing protein [Nakamurella alba]
MLQSDLIYLAQFEALSVWLDALEPGDLEQPSSLPGWSVGELIAHLCGTAGSISALRPVDIHDGTEPLTVSEYVAGYRASAEDIADLARQIAQEESLQPGVDIRKTLHTAHQQAVAALDRLGGADLVVATRRGPMLLSSFLDTRVLELVVHSLDLHRSLPGHPAPPVLSSAWSRVLTLLRELLTERADDPAAALAAASTMSRDEFVAAATGRAGDDPTDDRPLALTALLPLL